jgi:carboxylate-amine ligase
MKAPSLTLGVEEEYQIIDPRTGESAVLYHPDTERRQHGARQIKPELHQSMVEIGTNVCQTPADVRTELVRLRGAVMGLAAKNGL